MTEDYEEDFTHPIVKFTHCDDDVWTDVLDTMGNATLFQPKEKRLDQTVK